MTDTVNVPREAIEEFRKWYELDRGRAVLKGKARKIVARILAAAAPKAGPVSDPYKLDAGTTLRNIFSRHASRANDSTAFNLAKPDNSPDAFWDAVAFDLLSTHPEAPKVDQEPVAYVSRKGFTTGGLVWTKEGMDANLPDETKLYTHPAPAPASDELLEAIDMDDFNIIGDWIEGGEKGGAPSGRVKGLWQSVRRVIAKHKGPQS